MYKLRQKTRYNIIFILFFIISAALLHRKSYDKLPISVHAWQQSDHYALALGFLDNGFDFFHPMTYALNPEFPAKKELINPQGVTAIDFPILQYTAAFMMKIFNTRSPVVFRLLSLLWSFVALWFFFRTIKNIKGFWIAIFLCGFIMFQPIYSYYQDGFHVSGAAFNTFLIGCSYMLLYFHKEKYNLFLWGVLFLTLAALMRFTQIISLLALVSMYFYNILKNKKIDKNLLVVFLGIIIVLGYFGYNQYLRTTYGSLFQSEPRIASSVKEIMKHFVEIGVKYLRGFLPIVHLFTLGVIISLFIKRETKVIEQLQNFKIWGIFSLIGTFIFTILMSFHLSYHDYYSLDTWLPVLTLMIIYFIFSIDSNKISSKQISIFVIMFLIGSFAVAFEKQNIKYNPMRMLRNGDLVLDDFVKSANFLDSNISEDDKALIICHWGWNTPMIGWNRKAYRLAADFTKQFPLELNKDYDKIITHDATLNEIIVDHYPEFSSKVEFIKGNGKVSIWKLKN